MAILNGVRWQVMVATIAGLRDAYPKGGSRCRGFWSTNIKHKVPRLCCCDSSLDALHVPGSGFARYIQLTTDTHVLDAEWTTPVIHLLCKETCSGQVSLLLFGRHQLHIPAC
jgi:hypothetical protein